MTSQMRLRDGPPNALLDHDCVAGTDGYVAKDFFVAFDPDSGRMTEAVRAEIRHWSSTWLPTHPGAVVVMGCNGNARNSASVTRTIRLQALSQLLAECGVPEDRIRYTDEPLDLQARACSLPIERGVLCIKVLRPAVLDAAVMPISHLFLSLTAVEVDGETLGA